MKSQCAFREYLEGELKVRGLTGRSLGTINYSNQAPLLAVRQLMNSCDGAIILGFTKLQIKQIKQHDSEIQLPTPWNNLEAGIAFALNLPLLIICEEGISGGIFDIGASDQFIHRFTFPNTAKALTSFIGTYFKSDKFLQPFNEWHEKVILFDSRKKKESSIS